MNGSIARLSIFFAFVIALIWSTPSDAGGGNVSPGYYRAVSSGADEAMQIRAEPYRDSMLLGVLNDDDVIFSDGTREYRNDLNWQRIRQSQLEGWVEARHLRRALPKTLEKTDLPMAGTCGASLPPWALIWDDNSVHLSLYPEKYKFTLQSIQAGVSPGSVLVTGSAPQAAMSFVYGDEVCHGEGNAARSWGSAYILIRQNGGVRLYKGCCNASRTAFPNR
jgi:hypothetical protein